MQGGALDVPPVKPMGVLSVGMSLSTLYCNKSEVFGGSSWETWSPDAITTLFSGFLCRIFRGRILLSMVRKKSVTVCYICLGNG
jgi:hypothetical protein